MVAISWPAASSGAGWSRWTFPGEGGWIARPASGGASPQDVRVSPDGRVFYVADLDLNGVWLIDARRVPEDRLRPHRGRGPRPVPKQGLSLPVRVQSRERARSRSSPRDPQGGLTRGTSPAAAAPTWAGSPPTARSVVARVATTASCTRSTPRPADCSTDCGRHRTAWRVGFPPARGVLTWTHRRLQVAISRC